MQRYNQGTSYGSIGMNTSPSSQTSSYMQQNIPQQQFSSTTSDSDVANYLEINKYWAISIGVFILICCLSITIYLLFFREHFKNINQDKQDKYIDKNNFNN